MISAQNRPQLLSGNKYFFVVFLLLLFSACSPKIKPVVKKRPVIPEEVQEKKEVSKQKPKPEFTEATISLLVPFRLNSIDLRTAARADVEKSAMAIDFYQGFKMGLDSAANSGLNFKLKVYDTRDSNSQIEGLMQNGSLLSSNLIVGPVFPEGLKHIRTYIIEKNLALVNPLAATHPKEFNNPNMISVVSNVDVHAEKLGSYIGKHYDPVKSVVVLINPGSEDDEVLSSPLRKYFESTKSPFFFQEFASVFSMETKIIKNKKYVVLLGSSERKFVMATIDKLVKLKAAGLSIDLYGHPEWIKQSYNVDQLQALNTIISTTYKVDYRRPEVTAFIKKYRSLYSFEPGEYAFKGFDIGYYFASSIAAHGKNYLQFLTKDNYHGLQNNMSFVYDPKEGYINTSVLLLKYQDFSLNVLE